MSECLTPIEIELLMAGSLPPEDKACAEAHLGGCERCCGQPRERQDQGRLVDDLWQKYSDWKTVAARLREDTSFTEPLRRAALNEVLRRATDHP